MDGIVRAAKRHGLAVVEDAAQAHGAVYRGRRVGSLADAAAFSFYPSKNLGAFGDGGAITTDHEELADQVRMLRDGGQSSRYRHELRGVNSRLDELQAAILSVKLRYLDRDNDRRRQIAKEYLHGIENHAIRLPAPALPGEHVWHLFVVRTKDREGLRAHLEERGIGTLIHYPIPPHRQDAYREWNERSYPITEEIHASVLSLPIGPTMSEEDVARVIDACNSFVPAAGLAEARDP